MDLNKLKILFTEEEIQARIKDLAKEMNQFYNGEEVIAICVLKGAVMFAVDLIKNLDMPLKLEFIRLSSYNGGTTTTGKVNAVDISLPDLNNSKNVTPGFFRTISLKATEIATDTSIIAPNPDNNISA